MEWDRIFLETVDSTNSEAERRAQAGAPEGLVIMAGRQTAGRGRQGRSFLSPQGKGLYLTALLRPRVPARQATWLTAWTAVAVCDAIEAFCALRPRIKWPNDLILGDKKLCGILVEGRAQGEGLAYVLAGIGVNVNHDPEDFDETVRPIAVSLKMALGKELSIPALADCVLQSLGEMYRQFPRHQHQWLARYRADCLTLGRSVLLGGQGGRQAVARDIDQDFGLVVTLPDGSQETVAWGDVSVRGILGYV